MLFSWNVSICFGCKWIVIIQVFFLHNFKYYLDHTELLMHCLLQFLLTCYYPSWSATALVIETMEALIVALKLYRIEVNHTPWIKQKKGLLIGLWLCSCGYFQVCYHDYSLSLSQPTSFGVILSNGSFKGKMLKTDVGHIWQSISLIASNAAFILPAYWALRQKVILASPWRFGWNHLLSNFYKWW